MIALIPDILKVIPANGVVVVIVILQVVVGDPPVKPFQFYTKPDEHYLCIYCQKLY